MGWNREYVGHTPSDSQWYYGQLQTYRQPSILCQMTGEEGSPPLSPEHPSSPHLFPGFNRHCLLGGDKGGNTTKMNLQIVNVPTPNSIHNTCVFCCFAATDSVTNLHSALDRYRDQWQGIVEDLPGTIVPSSCFEQELWFHDFLHNPTWKEAQSHRQDSAQRSDREWAGIENMLATPLQIASGIMDSYKHISSPSTLPHHTFSQTKHSYKPKF
ncbi:hypothetical protein EMCRGX_G012355 [Ephydatia muelleri]